MLTDIPKMIHKIAVENNIFYFIYLIYEETTFSVNLQAYCVNN